MAILTFAQLEAEAAAWHAAEAASREPAAVACRALETLREALELMSTDERTEITAEIRELIHDQDRQAWAELLRRAGREG